MKDAVLTYFTSYGADIDIGCSISACIHAVAPQGGHDEQVRAAVEALLNEGHLSARSTRSTRVQGDHVSEDGSWEATEALAHDESGEQLMCCVLQRTNRCD